MTDASNRHPERRTIFDTVAERYDRVRPGYPDALFADLEELAGLEPGSHVLEIGCGTGQATMALAERGYVVTAVEIGPQLAAIARRRLAAYPAVEVVVAAFEEWPLPAHRFDAVFSATAFHWLDPAVRVDKAADALRPGGALAIVETHHVAGGTDPFFADAQRHCYERWDPETPPGHAFPREADVSIDTAELDRSDRFGPVAVRRYEWAQTYSTAEYRELLLTYSNHLALPDAAREGLLGCIGELMESRYGGRIAKRYLTQLIVAIEFDC